MFSQLVSINMLLIIFYSANQVRIVAVIVTILRATCRYVRGSAGPSLVHALCCTCSDITTSYPGLGAKEITAISKYLTNWIFCLDEGKGDTQLHKLASLCSGEQGLHSENVT
jgi:hypothetical protein